jgi:AcrR family transcriptional regulator
MLGLMAQRLRPAGRQDVVEALLEAASALLSERNPASVSVREIAKAAGVNHGLVHHYFGGKPQLIVAVLDRRARALADAVSPETDGRMALRSLFLGPDAQAFARLLAYARVEGWIAAGELEGWVTRRLLEVARADGTATVHEARLRLRVAAVLALMLGWELFRPTVLSLAGLDESRANDEELVDAALSLLAAGADSFTPG